MSSFELSCLAKEESTHRTVQTSMEIIQNIVHTQFQGIFSFVSSFGKTSLVQTTQVLHQRNTENKVLFHVISSEDKVLERQSCFDVNPSLFGDIVLGKPKTSVEDYPCHYSSIRVWRCHRLSDKEEYPKKAGQVVLVNAQVRWLMSNNSCCCRCRFSCGFSYVYCNHIAKNVTWRRFPKLSGSPRNAIERVSCTDIDRTPDFSHLEIQPTLQSPKREETNFKCLP